MTAITRKGWLHEDPHYYPLPTPCDDYRPMPGEHGFCGHCGWNGLAHDGSEAQA